MYKLEDRILFDGAAVADVTDAQQEAEAQQQEAAEAEEAAQQEAAENAESSENSEVSESDSSTAGDSDDPGSLESILAAIETGNTGTDGESINVLLVSNSLENADDIANATSSDTIVVRYDARTTSAADLLQQITDALGGKLADTIGFATESGENAAVQLFADTDTSLDTVNNSTHQDFFNSLNALMDEGAQVNLFASNLASTTEGAALVDAISDAVDHDVAASIDETGSEAAGGDWDLEYSTNDAETDVSDVYFDENLIENFDSLLEDHVSHEVAFINSSVMNVDEILNDLGDNVEVVYLEDNSGINYVTDYLNEHSDVKYDAIHIITHGNEGYFVLNGRNITGDYVQENAAEFVQWRNALSNDADIMIYGCNLAGSLDGESLVANIASLTGADVAASTDTVGGSDWSLEYNVGDINYGELDITGYDYHLTNRMVNTLVDEPVISLGDGVMSLRKAITESVDGDSITFATYTKLGGYIIELTSASDPSGYGQLEITEQISIDGTITVTASTYYRALVTREATQDDFRLLYISDTAGSSETPVDIYRMVFDDGQATINPSLDYVGEGNGGAIYISGAAQLRDVAIINSHADIDGGGIYVASTGYLKIVNDASGTSDCYVSWNDADTAGGGIFNNSGTLELVGGSASEFVDISFNTTSGSGGGVYSVGDITATYTQIDNNDGGGDGGGVYITGGTNLSSFTNSGVDSNTAGGDGGGIYFFQSTDLKIDSGTVSSNTAAGDGGGIYVNESRHLNNLTSSIGNNTAGGDGGGIYLTESGNFYHERGYINYNTAGGSGGAIYMTKSGYGVTGDYLSDLYLYGMDISGNTTNNSGVDGVGTIYYDGVRKTGVEGAGTTIAYMTAIDTNTVNSGGTGGAGGAIYQLAGDLSVWSSTLAFNTAATQGGSIYFSGTNLDVEFATLAYNEASANGGADIYLTGEQDEVKIINSLIYDDDTTTPESQIVLAGTTAVGNYIFNNNIYTNYVTDLALSSDLEAIVFTNGSGNIVNDGTATPSFSDGNWHVNQQAIIDNLYLDTAMRQYNNYYARVIPLLVDYNQAIAEGEFGHQNIAWQAGTDVSGYNSSIKYDTRGNTRIGWQYINTADAGDPAVYEYVKNTNSSIGAFEPIYTIGVTSKEGGGGSPFFDQSLANGMTLRDAIYWLDSYDAYTYANDATGGALYNSNRYVKFDFVEFASTVDNTITINADIDIVKSIIIGMTPWLNDQLKGTTYTANDISLTEMRDWGGYRAQNSTGRIIVDGSASDRIFQTTTTSSTPGAARRVYINNLTVTNGYADNTGTTDGHGGAIWNSTNLYLSNVAVTNSTADNKTPTYADNAGWGGGIYNTGNLTLVETTVSGNSAIGYSASTDSAFNAGLGGGIYSTGTLEIYSSSIHDNTAQGSSYVFNGAAMGAGIYFDGGTSYLAVVNSTISNNTNDAEYSNVGDLHGQGSAVYLASGDLYMYYNTVVSNTSVRNIEEATTGISAAIVSAYNYDGAASRNFVIINNIIADNDYSFTGNPKERNLFDLYLTATDTATDAGNVIVLNNIIGWTTGLTIKEGTGSTNNNNNIIGDAVYGKVANLNLEDTLAYNGGKTQSYKILDNSVAYQKGLYFTSSNPFYKIDQRGADRLYAGATTTIGSYQPLQYIVVTSLKDTNSASDVGFDFSSNSGGWMKADLQLREAFALADIYTQVIMSESIGETTPTVILNQAEGFGELVADIGFTLDGRSYLTPQGTTANYSEAAAAYTIVLKGAQDTDINPLVIDGTDTSRVIRISDSTPTNINITVSYVTLQNGVSETQGGAIYNLENLTLDHVSVIDSSSTLQGGGIYSQVGTLTITDSTIQGNTSATQGGGLYYESNRLDITRSSFLENTSTTSGGGLYVVGAQVKIDSSTIGDNISGAHGGGLYSDSSNIYMVNSTVANNTADENGGGIVFNGGGYLRMGYVTIANNISGADPDSVQKLGGGLYQSAGSLNIYNSIIAQNYETSVATANLNDIYLGTAVSFTAAEVQYNVLGVINNNSSTTISTVNNRVYSAGLYGGLVLNIDTVLADNGGDTQTIYVGDLDTAAINYGADLYYLYTAATNTYALAITTNPGGYTEITKDQRGETRTSGSITVGAYQKNTTDYVFDDNTGDHDYANYLNWTKGGIRLTSASELDFDASDARFYIAADLNTGDSVLAASDTWAINWRSILILNDTYTLTVADGDTLNARIDVQGTMTVDGTTSNLIVRGYSSIDSSGTGSLTVNGAISTVDTTLNGESRLELLNEAELTLATISYSAASMNLVYSPTDPAVSTVSYTDDDAETQLILDLKDTSGASTAYGNLILSGSSEKTFGTNLTVKTLDISSALDLGGNLTITDAAGGGSTAGASINMTGDLTLGTTSTSFQNVDFTFDGTSAQTITLVGSTPLNSTTFNSITTDNSARVSLTDGGGSSSDSYTLTLNDFTFSDGAFELQDTASLYIADGGTVSGADGDLGQYFITTGTGTVSQQIDASGTHFVLAVEDGDNPGTYKWVDTLITQATPTRAAIAIADGITPAIASSLEDGAITVTWDINTSDSQFTFDLADYSDNAAGKYFDPAVATFHWDDGGWQDSSFTTTNNGSFYVGHGYSEVWLNADDVSTAGTLRYALANLTGNGVIVFSATHADSDFAGTYADIQLNSALLIADGVNISIFGLTTGNASYITAADGQSAMVIGGGTVSETVTLKNLDFRGNGAYVLENNEILTLANVSVAGVDTSLPNVTVSGKWTDGTINNDGAISVAENMYLKLDGSADGTAFTYGTGSTLEYMLTPGETSGTISIDDNSAEFGTSLQGLTVDSGVALTLSDRTGAYVLNGDVDINGSLELAGATSITLNGTNNDLGIFIANQSTVIYNDALDIDDVTYYNLTLSGTGDKTAFNVTATNLEFDSDITLSVSGSMTVSTLTNNNQGTVSYSGADQTVTDLDYYNLSLDGTGTKAASSVSTDNNLVFGTDVTLTVSDTLSITGSLVHNSQGTVNYIGDENQTIFGTTYYNLQIANDNKALAAATTVAGTFTFNSGSGYLALGNYDLNIQGALSGASGTDGRYFATNGTGNLVLSMDTTTYASRNIVIGSTLNWSSLALTNLSGAAQTLSLSAADGVDNVVVLTDAVNMTFTVDSGSTDFRMTISDSSAKGADFSAANASVYYFNTTSSLWEDKGRQSTATLSNTGNYYFDSGAATDRGLVVTNTYDSGFGSLRGAIEYANEHEGVDIITFSGKVFNSEAGMLIITLTSGELSITDDVIIQGPGNMVVTVSGGGSSRIFNINDGTSTVIMANISGLTITSGDAGLENGGAIYNNELLLLSDTIVQNSTAVNGGGIYNDTSGAIYINRVKMTGNNATDGGGIYNNGGSIQAENLWMNLNTADNDGGGIYNRAYTEDVIVDEETVTVYHTGDIMLQNTTLSSNTADNDGDLDGSGGGIFTQGRLYAENVTISYNEASQGSAINIDGQATSGTTVTTLYNNTIALNTASVAGSSAIYRTDSGANDSFYVNSSLFAGNYDGATYRNISTGDTTSYNNYYVGDAGNTSTGIFTDTSPADHGGWVPTLALNTTNATVLSSIMDSGTNNGPSIYDGRGYMRNGVRDIGAFEAGRTDGAGTLVEAGALVAINTSRDTYYTSIQNAIKDANSGDTVELLGTRYYLTSELTIANDLILVGQGSDTTVLDAQTLYTSGAGANRLLTVNNTSDTIFVRVDSMAFVNGDGTGDTAVNDGLGGAIYNSESLLLENVLINGSTAATNGGGIYNNGGYLYVDRSELYNNSVTAASASGGGAIYNDMGKVVITESTLHANTVSGTTDSGGAIFTYDDGTGSAYLTITSSTIYDNSATAGGAIYAYGANQIQIVNSTFVNNTATYGGAMYFIGGGTYELNNLTVALNTSSSASGYALTVYDGDLYIVNSLVANNVTGKNYSTGTATVHTYSTYNYLQANGSNFDDTIFATNLLEDNGGWVKTIAISTSNTSIYNAGTNIGVPGYDARGYETNGARDIGAYEYMGYIGKVSFPNNDEAKTENISSLDEIDDYPEYKGDSVVTLINSRILAYNTSVNMWYKTGLTKSTDPKYAARNITVYGHASGGTVISGGSKGNLFTLNGRDDDKSESPAAVMGDFTIERVTLSDGFAVNGPVVTGVNNDNNVGSFIASEVTFANNIATGAGGALYVAKWDKQLGYTISNSTFDNNIAYGAGGAIYSGSAVTLSLSTIADNRSFDSGGAIYISTDGDVTLSESTVALNHASDVGGGVYNAGTFNVSGNLNLLAKNTHAGTNGYYSGYDYYLSIDPEDPTKYVGTLTAGTNNMVEYQNGTWVKDVTTNFFRTHDDDGERLNYVGPQQYVFATDYLADNGGWTNTLALSEYSAALDPESERGGTDQRGYGANNWRDIGAMELGGTYVTLASNSKKYSSISNALVDAVSGDTITLSAVRSVEHDIQISKDLTIVSDTTEGTDLIRGTQAFIDAKNYGRIFFIASPSTDVTMSNLYLSNGMSLVGNTSGVQQAAGNGGAIYNAGTLTATHLSVIDSFAQVSGGGIYSSKALSLTTDDTRVKLIDVEFRNNSAGVNGGAVYASGTISVSGSAINGTGAPLGASNMYNFWDNSAKNGGAIYTSDASDAGDTPAFKGIYARANSASLDGGGLYVNGGDGITIAQSYFVYNGAINQGGAIYQTNSDLTVWDTAITDNLAFSDGGAIYFNGGNAASMTIYASSEDTMKYMYIHQNYSISGDGGAIHMAYGADLNIYSERLLYGVDFYSNRAYEGDGGAIYFVNSNDINIGRNETGIISNNVEFMSNYAYSSGAKGHGGAIYMANSNDFNATLNVHFLYNQADADGGALYIYNSQDINMNTANVIASNFAWGGSGGGAYFEAVGDLTLNYLELGANYAFSGSGGGIYVKNSGDVTLTDIDAYSNYASANGGALYVTDNTASNLSIKSSSFSHNFAIGSGGAVYVNTAGSSTKTIQLENVTFAYNNNTAFYLIDSNTSINVSVKYATFSQNTDTTNSGMYLEAGNFSMANSIIYETVGAPIAGSFTVESSNHNVLYRFDDFSGSAEGLSAGATTPITAYNEGGGIGGSETVLDASSNIVGTAGVTNTFISNNLYLSTEMLYHANNLTRAFALESRDSIAYHYSLNGTDTRAGASDIDVKYDQRGNLRSGVTVVQTPIDPNDLSKGYTTSYVYYQPNGGSWQKVTVAEDGTATYSGAGAVYTSIGAFEPNFYITTTSSEDNNSNPEFVVHSSDNEWHSFDIALTDAATSGLTLREAIFWIDTYKLGSTSNTSNTFSEDGSRYVKFTDSMINDGNTTITLNSSAEYISIRNDVIVGMVDNYTDGTTTYDFFEADNTFTNQADGNIHRITVSAGGNSRIFKIYTTGDYTGNYYSAKVGLNNITIADGLEDGSSTRYSGSTAGRGGAIYNTGTLTLHNVVVKDSEASNANVPTAFNKTRSGTGYGGGIYTADSGYGTRSGYLYIYDSTIDNNVARGTEETTDTNNVGFGGGIYVGSGTVETYRSTVSSNNTYGFNYEEGDPQQSTSRGAGLYINSGTTTFEASTFTDNGVNSDSSGGYFSGYGDAIFQSGGTLTLNSNTIAYNRVYKFKNAEGKAVYLVGGSSYLTNNIFANNYVRNLTEQVSRDILAYNVVTDSNNIVGYYGTSGHNFEDGTGNITGDNATGKVNQLYLSNELKYNGGMTQNYRLGANSVAINAGGDGTTTTAVSTYDQRGLDRSTYGGGLHSIGSYELLESVTAYTVDASNDLTDIALSGGDIMYDYNYTNGRFGGEVNMRNALYLADQNATVTIQIAQDSEGEYIDEINLAENAGAFLVFNDVTVNSYGGQITIDGSKGGGSVTVDEKITYIASRAMIIDNSNFEVPSLTALDVTINGFDIQNTAAVADSYDGHGGAIYSIGHLAFKNGDITTFTAAGAGGALYVSGGDLNVDNVTITGTNVDSTGANVFTSGGSGGAIYVASGSIINSRGLEITGTRANGHGGAIYVNNAVQTFSLTDSSISDAHAEAGSGGAIYYTGQSMTLTSVNIYSNSASSDAAGGSGGGLYANISGTITITGSTFGGETTVSEQTVSLGNTASNLGGGLYVNSGSLNINGSTIQNNTASVHGGGMFTLGSNVTIAANGTTLSQITGNTATLNGGGIYNQSGSLTISGTMIGGTDSTAGNTAGGSGGGIYNSNGAVTLSKMTMANNAAGVNGGAIFSDSDLTIVNSTLAYNTADNSGGAIYFSSGSGTLDITYATIAYNHADNDDTDGGSGGGIYANQGSISVVNSIIAGNYKGSASTTADDFYVNTTLISLADTDISYSGVGTFNTAASSYFSGTGMITGAGIVKLGLGTELESFNNSAPMLYLQATSTLANAGITVSTTTSQNNVPRVVGTAPNGPDMGAYENNPAGVTYYYVSGAVNVASSWNTVSGGGGTAYSGDFTDTDGLFVFDANSAVATLAAGIWTIGSRTTVDIQDGGSFTINDAASIVASPVGSDPAKTNFTVTGTGSIDIGVADTAFYTPVSLTVSNTSSTTYSLADDQTIYTTTYGDLTILNGGEKTAKGTITVAGDLAVTGSTYTNTGATNVTGSATLTDATLNVVDMSAASFNATGSTITSTGDVTATTITMDSSSLSAIGTVTGTTSTTLDAASITADTITTGTVTADSGISTLIADTYSITSFDVNNSGSKLRINNSSDITIMNAGSPTFDSDSMTVDSGAIIEFYTTGKAGVTITNGAAGIAGTLSVIADEINPLNVSLTTGSLSVTSLVEPINLTGLNINGSITFGGKVILDKDNPDAGNDITVTSGAAISFSGTVDGNGNSLITNSTTFTELNDISNLLNLTVNATETRLTGDVSGAGTIDFVGTGSGAVKVYDNASVSGATINAGVVSGNVGTENLSLTATSAGNTITSISNLADLTLGGSEATYTMGGLINISGTLTNNSILNMAANTISTDSFNNTGTLNNTSIVTTTGNLTNSGSFTTGVANANGNITNTATGNMTIGALNLNDSGKTSTLSLNSNGTVNITSLNVAADKQAQLTDGDLTVNAFTFVGANSSSKFDLNAQTMEVTGTLTYNATSGSNENYFITSGGGMLIQTMTGGVAAVYRVGNDRYCNEITITVASDGERVAVGVIDSVKINGTEVTGIAETDGFTEVITRNVGGTSYTDSLAITMDYDAYWEGSQFNPGGIDVERFEFINGVWESQGIVTVNTAGGRSTVSYIQPHNGTYTLANQGANLTIPITNLNGNIALYEMSNPDFSPRYDSFYLDVDNITNFPIGTYPYFSASWYPTGSSVGKAVYQQMEYRLVTNPLTNLLEGQVPPIGSIVGQAITKGASLTLTADAPVYLEVNGEYTIGKGWLPFGVPASAANIEQFQAPITQGQLDEFYLDFGGREGLFETPASFRSDLDEMIDDLLAG